VSRIQVLSLPTETVGAVTRTPYILVLDETGGQEVEMERGLVGWLDSKPNGPLGVMVFHGTCDVLETDVVELRARLDALEAREDNDG